MLLAGLVLITVPLHWWGLNHPWRTSHAATQHHATATHRTAQAAVVARSTPFLLLMLGKRLTGLAVFAVIINLVPMLVEQGLVDTSLLWCSDSAASARSPVAWATHASSPRPR